MHPVPYNHYDIVTGITVAEIILHFLASDSKRVVFYICHPTDGKIKARSRKFNYWYKLFSNNDFSKIVADIDKQGVKIEANFIFLKSNTLVRDIPDIIDEARNNLNNK